MNKVWICLMHDRPLEIVCLKCKALLCIECLYPHEEDGHVGDYVHVFDYAPGFAYRKIDELMKAQAATAAELEVESGELLQDLCGCITPLKTTVDAHLASVSQLNAFLTKLDSYMKPTKYQPMGDRMRMGLTGEKKRLEKAIEEQDLKVMVETTKSIISQGENLSKGALDKSLIREFKNAANTNSFIKLYRELIDSLQLVLYKCQSLKLTLCVNSWRCDEQYLSPNARLSPDGLTITMITSAGYHGVIGDTPLDYGVLAYEVTPHDLCCDGKEGFGIIELDKFKKAYEQNPRMPTVYQDMIGLFQGNKVQGMEVLSEICELIPDMSYIVKIDMTNSVCTIRSPAAFCTAQLKSEVTYVPCFSLGCEKNSMTIRCLDGASEEDY